jgi:hypothetical protein
MGPIVYPETSVITHQRRITAHKSEDVTYKSVSSIDTGRQTDPSTNDNKNVVVATSIYLSTFCQSTCVRLPSNPTSTMNVQSPLHCQLLHRWTTPEPNQRLIFKWTRSLDSRPCRKQRAFYQIARGISSEWNVTVID